MWITKNGKNYYTIYMCKEIYRKALDRCKHTMIQQYNIYMTYNRYKSLQVYFLKSRYNSAKDVL